MANIYISPTGNDTTGDGSQANPWKTVRKANAMAQPGDTVWMADGTYRLLDGNENEYFTFASGTSENQITWRPINPGNVSWNGQYQVNNWVQDSAKLWHVSLAGLPILGHFGQDSSAEYMPDNIFPYLLNDFPPVEIYNIATCTGSAACAGRYTLYNVHNGKPYYITRSDPTSGASYYLYWTGTRWRIAATLDAASNYWELAIDDAATPQSATAYTAHGSCTGSPSISYAEVPSVGTTVVPADFTNPPAQALNDATDAVSFWHNGQLVFSLSYYDVVNQVLFLKLNDFTKITNLNTQAWIFNPNLGVELYTPDYSAGASYITIQDITLLPGTFIGLGANASGTAIKRVRMSSIVKGNPFLHDCYFDYIGHPRDIWAGSNGVYTKAIRQNTTYGKATGTGTNPKTRGCFFGRNRMGADIYYGGSSIANYQCYDNVVYSHQFLFMAATAGGEIYNNSFFLERAYIYGVAPMPVRPGMAPIYQIPVNSGVAYHNNYLEVGNCGAAAAFNFGGSTTSATGSNNIAVLTDAANGASESVFVWEETGDTFGAWTSCLWISNGDHGFWSGNTPSYGNNAAFQVWMNGLGSGHVYIANAAERISPQAVEAFLDTNPTLADAKAFFRRWATRLSGRNTAYAAMGPVLNLAYEDHPATIVGDGTIRLLDSSASVMIGGDLVEIGTDGTYFYWDGLPMSVGDTLPCATGGVTYEVSVSAIAASDCTLAIHVTTLAGETVRDVLRQIVGSAGNIPQGGATESSVTALASAVAAIPTTPLLANDARLPAPGHAIAGASELAEVSNQLEAIEAKTNTLGSASVVVSSPIVNGVDLELVQFDDYLVANGRQIDWSNSAGNWFAGNLSGAIATFTAKSASGATIFACSCAIVAAMGTQLVRLELPAAKTGLFTMGGKSYSYQLLLQKSGYRETEITGDITITTTASVPS